METFSLDEIVITLFLSDLELSGKNKGSFWLNWMILEPQKLSTIFSLRISGAEVKLSILYEKIDNLWIILCWKAGILNFPRRYSFSSF